MSACEMHLADSLRTNALRLANMSMKTCMTPKTRYSLLMLPRPGINTGIRPVTGQREA